MSTNKIILILIVVVLILGLGVIVAFKFLPQAVKPINQNLNVAPINQPVNVAPTAEYVPPPAYAVTYYREKSISEQSLAPCLKLELASLRDSCLVDTKVYLLAKASDAKFCLHMPLVTDQYDCVKEYAFSHSQPQECEILSFDYKSMCQEYYGLNKSVLGDPKVCQIIIDLAKRTQCADTAYFYQSMNGNDSCNKISNESLKQTCSSKAY